MAAYTGMYRQYDHNPTDMPTIFWGTGEVLEEKPKKVFTSPVQVVGAVVQTEGQLWPRSSTS